MFTIAKPQIVQNEVKNIHVRLVDNCFHESTDSRMQILSQATGMTHATFTDFFSTMVARNKEFAMNSPLYRAFRHCFPDKQVIIDDSQLMDKVTIVTVPLTKQQANDIINDLLERTASDYEKHREVQSIANVLQTATAETYLPWVRLARIAAVGEALDQKHINAD